MKRKKLIVFVLLIVVMLFTIAEAASYPKIMTNINSSLKTIQEWLVKIATPAAAIGVITGALMKKFSFGDPERMVVARRLIRSSLTSYALVVGIDLVLKAVDTFVAK